MIKHDHAADSKLLLRCGRQDKSALKQLYHQHSKTLYAIAYLHLKQRRLAELALEKTFIDIWSTAGDFEPKKSSTIKWMSKITRFNTIQIGNRLPRYKKPL